MADVAAGSPTEAALAARLDPDVAAIFDRDLRGIRAVAIVEVALCETRAAFELGGFARLQLAPLGCGLAKRAVPVMWLTGPMARQNNRLGNTSHHETSRMMRAK